MKALLLTGLLFIGVIAAYSQTSNCGQKLRLANSIYDQGRLHELEGILQPCLESGGFSPTEQVAAYKFLVLAYIYLEEPEKADATMLKLLKADHYFTVNDQVDPAEFKALYKTFRTWEIYRLGIKLGGNLTQTNFSGSNNVTNGSSKYTPGYGFSASLIGEIPLHQFSPRLTFAPELQVQLSSFKGKTTETQMIPTADGSVSTFQTTTIAKQSLSYVSVPLLIQYEFGDKNLMNNANRKLRPYVTAGVSPDYLFSGSLAATETRQPGFSPVDGTNKSLSGMNKINVNAILGAGFRWRVAGGFFIVEARYKYGFSRIPVESQAYANQEQVFNLKYAPGVYNLNAISLSVGYVQNFFKPVKLKKGK